VISEAILGLRHVKIFSVEARELELVRDLNRQQT